MQTRLDNAFSPTLIGARSGAVNYTEIMDAEREKLRVSEKNTKIIKAVVDRLFHEEEKDEAVYKNSIRQIFEDIFGKMKKKPPKPDIAGVEFPALGDGSADAVDDGD